MVNRLALALSLLLSISSMSRADSKRDFAAHPAIVELDTPYDVFAIGDVHSDYQSLTRALVGAKLIDHADADPNKLTWTGGESVLVCTGDFLDKGDNGLACIAALRHLQQSGHVIVTMGNHEAEFLAGAGSGKKKKSKKVTDQSSIGKLFTEELAANKIDADAIRKAVDAGGIGAFLRDLPVGARVNDSFFSHAGNTHGMSVVELNKAIASEITENGFGAPILQDPDSILQARLHPQQWWDIEGGAATLQKNLKALGVKRLVIGHQPGKIKFTEGGERKADTMYADPNGRFVLIDIGMSRGVDGTTPALLKIHGSELSEVSADGTSKLLTK
jgi:predicted MPP superfamily phosphohydrolase